MRLLAGPVTNFVSFHYSALAVRHFSSSLPWRSVHEPNPSYSGVFGLSIPSDPNLLLDRPDLLDALLLSAIVRSCTTPPNRILWVKRSTSCGCQASPTAGPTSHLHGDSSCRTLRVAPGFILSCRELQFCAKA